MTTYYSTLSLQYLGNSTPPSTTLNITSSDIILLGIDTSSYSDGSDWLRFGTSGCTVTPTSGFDGQEATITPTAGATSYSATFRTYNDGIPGFYYGKISGTISAPPTSDTTPDAFTFTDQTGVALSSTITSNTITVSGIDSITPISVTGGTYSINGGAYTSSSGTVTNGQTVAVQHTSSGSNSTATNTTLNIGGVSDVFTSTTVAAAPDTTPDAFTFIDQTNVALNTVITSAAITVSGITAAAAISITGGTYSINGGAYTSSSGTVTNGQTVTVRHTSSGSNSTATNTTLTIGGVSDIFTSITAAAATPTYSVGNASTNEGASATANVTTTNVANGTTLYWTVDATTADVSITSGSFSINTNTGSFTIPAIADSLTEGSETYNIRVRTGSTAGTIVASSILTINDTSTTPAATYALTFYTSGFIQTSTFNEGDSFYVFINTTGVPNGTYYWSTSSGSDLVAPVNGSFLIDSNFGSLYLTIATDSLIEGTENLTIYIRSGSVSGTILGSSSITINDTSVVADTTPDAFTFTDQSNVALNTVITSNTITVSGINAATAISITGGTYSISGGAYTSTSGTVTNGQTVTVQHTSSGANSTATNTTLTIGGVSDVFTSTTVAAAADTVPNAFIFADQNDVAVSSTIVSSEIEILGINTGAPISITGGEYSIGLDPTTYTPYTSASGTIYNTQTVKVRHTSSSANNTSTSTTLTIGGVSDVFTSTTIGAIGAGIYGLQIFDSLGNITLDTSDNTIKDFGIFSVASVTTNGTITGVPLTSNSIVLVNNNNGDGNTAIAAPAVTLAPASSSIVVSGGAAGFDVSIRVMEF